MAPFRPSLRETVTRLTLLAATSWLLLRMAARLDVRMVTVMTVVALGVMLALHIARRGPQTELLAGKDNLKVRGPEGDRSIPWAALESVRLTAGDVSTPRGDVRVCYAHVDLTHGPPLAFSDLSSMGSPRLRTAEGDAPVLDVGDPELLLGRIAERLDAREFLPETTSGVSGADDLRGAFWVASPLTTARLCVMALVASRVLPLLWGDHGAALAALGGAMAVAAPHAILRLWARRYGGAARYEVGAPPAVALGAVVALLIGLSRALPSSVGHWALACAILCALPSWPLPGALIARSIGRWFSALSDGPNGLAVAALGALVALMCARGMVLLPMVLVAGGLEVAEGSSASRRHCLIADLPRFSRSAPEAVARLRALLRPLSPGETDAQLGPRDLEELRRALSPPPNSSRLVPVLASLLALTVALLVARGVIHGADQSGQRALGWFLT